MYRAMAAYKAISYQQRTDSPDITEELGKDLIFQFF